MSGKLARNSDTLTDVRQSYVYKVRLGRKSLNLIRGGLTDSHRQKSAEAIVVDGVTTIRGGQGNLPTGRRAER